MSQFFHENAHNHIDPIKYGEGWDHIFKCKGCELKKSECECDQTKVVSDCGYKNEENGETK